MSEWISVYNELPKDQEVLVRFTMKILGYETPFMDKVLYAQGYFDHTSGWNVENRYITDIRYEQPYLDFKIYITHWMPLPKATEES